MSAPASYQELTELLRGRLPKLASGQLRLAHLVLADPEGTAYRGISDVAKLAEVRESTVTRFANSVGLSGYPAIMELCRSWLAEQAQLTRRGSGDGHEVPGGTLSAALEQERANLNRTYTHLDAASWARAIDVLSGAEPGTTSVLGLRDSRPIADILARRLRARLLGASLVDEFAELPTVLVVVSVRRYAAETVRAAEYVRERGAHVVALTDNAASPLVEYAHAALFAETIGFGGEQSLTALTALAQTLAREVVIRRGDEEPDEDLPRALGFYWA